MKKINNLFLVLVSFTVSSSAFGALEPYADTVISFTAGSDTTATSGSNALGSASGSSVSLGKDGEIILRYDDNIALDGSGNDIQVSDNGPNSESYTISFSSDNGSTWSAGQSGSGTAGFDLSGISGLQSINGTKFVNAIKIKDSGSTDSSPTCGLDLAAVTALNPGSPVYVLQVDYVDNISLVVGDGSANVIQVPEYLLDTRYKTPTLTTPFNSDAVNPVAYVKGAPMKAKIQYWTPNAITSATITPTLLSTSGSASPVTFTSGTSSEITVTFGSVATPQSQTTNITFAVTAIDGGSASFALPSVPARIYTLWAAPVAPFVGDVWASALEFSTDLSRGSANALEVGQNIASRTFRSDWLTRPYAYVGGVGGRYVYSGNSANMIEVINPNSVSILSPAPTTDGVPNMTYNFILSNVISGFAATSAGTYEMNCSAIAGWIQLMCRVQGLEAHGLRFRESAILSGVYASDTKRNVITKGSVHLAGIQTPGGQQYGFDYHEVVTFDGINPADGSETSYSYGFFPEIRVADATVTTATTTVGSYPTTLTANSNGSFAREFLELQLAQNNASYNVSLIFTPTKISTIE